MAPSEKPSGTARFLLHPGLDVSPILEGRAAPPAQPLSVSSSLASARLAGIDLLRITAAIGIIWFHTEGAPYVNIGYAGLPMFLLIYFSLITKRSDAHPPSEFLRRRWNRLLKPWLFWSVVYGAGKLAKAIYAADWSSLERLLSLETLLAGTSLHLWYLPYAFACGLLLYTINRRLAKGHDALVVGAATLLGVLTLVACTVGLYRRELPPPLPQWEFGLAAIPLGLALGRCLTIPSRRVQVRLLSLVAAATVGVSALLTSRGLTSTVMPYGLAVVLVCLAYSWPIRGNACIAAVAPLTLGIYLVHPLVARGLLHLLPAQGHYATFIFLTACLSGAVTWALMQTPLRRFV